MPDTAQVTGNVTIGSTVYDVGTLNFTLTGGAPPPSVPGQVTGLSANNIQQTSFNLDWNDVSGATSYVVQGKTGSNDFTTVASPTASFLTVTGLSANTTYIVRVAAINSVGQGTYSNELTVTTPPTPPPTGGNNVYTPNFAQALDSDWGFIYNRSDLRRQQNYAGRPSLQLRKQNSHGFYQTPQTENEYGAVPVVYRKGYRDGGVLKPYKMVNGLKIQFRSGFVKNNFFYSLGQGGLVLFSDDPNQAEQSFNGRAYTKIDTYVKALPQEYGFGNQVSNTPAHPVVLKETNGVADRSLQSLFEAPLIEPSDTSMLFEVVNGRYIVKYRFNDNDPWVDFADTAANIPLGTTVYPGFYAETDHLDGDNDPQTLEYVFFQDLVITTPVS